MNPRWPAALVTGASAGIGEAVARDLAGRGTSTLVLVARRRDRLDALAAELTRQHPGLGVEVLVADLTAADGRDRVAERLGEGSGGAPVDLLVNNAGFGTAGRFWELDPGREQREIDLNVSALVALTHAALGPMVARGRGTVLNVSSLAGNQPTPTMATYGATKAFVTLFTEAIAEELRGTGVGATAVLPGFTRTEFAAAIGSGATPETMAPDFAWMSAQQVAAEALDAAAAGRVLCIPGRGYRVLNALEAPLPRSARRWAVARLSGLPARLAR